MSFDKIFDLTAGVYFNFNNMKPGLGQDFSLSGWCAYISTTAVAVPGTDSCVMLFTVVPGHDTRYGRFQQEDQGGDMAQTSQGRRCTLHHEAEAVVGQPACCGYVGTHERS